jgi:carboxypeptidase Q
MKRSLLALSVLLIACRTASTPDLAPSGTPTPADSLPIEPTDSVVLAISDSAVTLDTADSVLPPQFDPPVPAEPAAVRAIVTQGMGSSSRAAADLQYLTDVIGPRLTGSDAMQRANEWAAGKFREYGMDSTWLERWQFGRGWERGPMTLRMLAPHERWLTGYSWGWSPGTDGPVTGDVVYVDAKSAADFRRRFAGKLQGAWVMTAPPFPMFNPDAPAPSAADSARMLAERQALYAPAGSAEEWAFLQGRLSLLLDENIAGLVRDGAKEFALATMSGSPEAIYPVPHIVVPRETYTHFHRLITLGERVRIEVDISNSFTPVPVPAYNTLAEIRGVERPEEVVLLGAHLDSWDLGTGATDNGSGAIAVLEAARILRASKVAPKRTIRFALFSGEEQGLFGSAAYATAHAAELRRHQAVLVLDNGTGRITGVALQGHDDLHALWTEILGALEGLGPFQVRAAAKGGTDHLSFLPYGVPAFNYDQEPRGYDHTHHSQVDTFDHAVIEDVQQSATVMAASAYQLANLPELLPRMAALEMKR